MSAAFAAKVMVPAAVAAPAAVAKDTVVMPKAPVMVLPPIAVASSTRKVVKPVSVEVFRSTSPGLIIEMTSSPVKVAGATAVAKAVAEPEEIRKVSIPPPNAIESPAFKVAPVPITAMAVSELAVPENVSVLVVSGQVTCQLKSLF